MSFHKMNFCKGVGKEEKDYHAGTGRGIKKNLVDYLPPKNKMQPETPMKYGLKNMQEKKKGISVAVVAVEGAKLPRMYPVKAARSR